MSRLIGSRLTFLEPGMAYDLYDISVPVVHREPSFAAGDVTERPRAWTVVVACSSDGTTDGVLQLGIIPTADVTATVLRRARAGEFERDVETCTD